MISRLFNFKQTGAAETEAQFRERKEKERIELPICKQKIKEIAAAYPTDLSAFQLFDTIRDELSPSLKNQFQNIINVNTNIQQYLMANKILSINDVPTVIDKLDLNKCNELLKIITEFNTNIKQFDYDLYNYIGNNFAKSIVNLQNYAAEIDDIYTKNPDRFAEIAGADYNIIEAKVYKSQAIIENKFKKLEPFMNKFSSDYTPIINVLSKTVVTLNTASGTPTLPGSTLPSSPPLFHQGQPLQIQPIPLPSLPPQISQVPIPVPPVPTPVIPVPTPVIPVPTPVPPVPTPVIPVPTPVTPVPTPVTPVPTPVTPVPTPVIPVPTPVIPVPTPVIPVSNPEPETPVTPVSNPETPVQPSITESDNCKYDSKKPRNIYHIVTKNTTLSLNGVSIDNSNKIKGDSKNFGLSTYEQFLYKNDPSLENYLENIFKNAISCNENMLIFCSSVEKNVSIPFNNSLKKINKRLGNVTIIHETVDSGKIINMVFDNNDISLQLIRKITNVLPLNSNLSLHKSINDNIMQDVQPDKTYVLESLEGKSSPVAPISFDGYDGPGIGGIQAGGALPGKVFIQFRKTSPPTTPQNLDEWWWYRWYFNVPPCANGRLMQLSGTCWFNASINVFLLSPTISKYLMVKWIALEKDDPDQATYFKNDINFNACFNPNNPKTGNSLQDMIYFLVYNILIANKKLAYNNGNISAIPGAIVGDAYKDRTKEEKSKEFNHEKINKEITADFFALNKHDAEGGDPSKGVRILMESMFPDNEIFAQRLITNKTSIDRNTKVIDISQQIFAGDDEIKTLPNILEIHNGQGQFIHSAPRKVTIKLGDKQTAEYYLEASTLGVDGKHAIAGLLCDNNSAEETPYIYDSNNVIALSDWTNNEYTTYLKAVQEANIQEYAQSKESMQGMSALIYVKETFKNALNNPEAIVSNVKSNVAPKKRAIPNSSTTTSVISTYTINNINYTDLNNDPSKLETFRSDLIANVAASAGVEPSNVSIISISSNKDQTADVGQLIGGGNSIVVQTKINFPQRINATKIENVKKKMSNSSKVFSKILTDFKTIEQSTSVEVSSENVKPGNTTPVIIEPVKSQVKVDGENVKPGNTNITPVIIEPSPLSQVKVAEPTSNIFIAPQSSIIPLISQVKAKEPKAKNVGNVKPDNTNITPVIIEPSPLSQVKAKEPKAKNVGVNSKKENTKVKESITSVTENVGNVSSQIQDNIDQQPTIDLESIISPSVSPEFVNAISISEKKTSCKYDPNLSRNIYHIVNEGDPILDFSKNKTGGKKVKGVSKKKKGGKQPVEGENIYTRILNDTDIDIKLENLFTELSKCNENCLIMCSSREKDISNSLNKALGKITERGKALINITIIHETVDSRRMVFMIYDDNKNQLIRKITNVFPTSYNRSEEDKNRLNKDFEKAEKIHEEAKKDFEEAEKIHEEAKKNFKEAEEIYEKPKEDFEKAKEIYEKDEKIYEKAKEIYEKDEEIYKEEKSKLNYDTIKNTWELNRQTLKFEEITKKWKENKEGAQEEYNDLWSKFGKYNADYTTLLKNIEPHSIKYNTALDIYNAAVEIKKEATEKYNAAVEIKKEATEKYNEAFEIKKEATKKYNEAVKIKKEATKKYNEAVEIYNSGIKLYLTDIYIHVNIDTIPNPYQRIIHEDPKTKVYPYKTIMADIKEENIYKKENNEQIRIVNFLDNYIPPTARGSYVGGKKSNDLIIPKSDDSQGFFNYDVFFDTWNGDKNTIPQILINANKDNKNVGDVFEYLTNLKKEGKKEEEEELKKDNENRSKIISKIPSEIKLPPIIKPFKKEGIVFFQIRNTLPPDNPLEVEKWWWYRWYYAVPPCASGRLVQMTGTCWFNAALNTILLSPIISRFLIIQWYSLKKEERESYEKQDIQTCLIRRPDIKTMLYVVIYNILIKNTKMSLNKGNLVVGFAARVATFIKEKGRLEKSGIDNASNISSLQISEGSDPGQAIELLLKATISDHFNSFYISNNIKLDKNILNISDTNNKLNGNNKLKSLSNIILLKNSKILSEERKEELKKEELKSEKQKNEEKKHMTRTKYFESLPLELTISIDDKQDDYVLEAGIISVLGVANDHAIAGLLCNNVPYIYDSNNVTVISDWTNNEYEPYTNALREKKINNYGIKLLETETDASTIEGVQYAIYIKKTFKQEINSILLRLESNL